MAEASAEKKAREAAAKYAAKQHRYQAMNIARTELAYAYNAGSYGATKDAQAQGYIDDCKKTWLTAYDERVCPICGTIEGESVNMDALFSIGKRLPPAHPSCRCAVAYEEITQSLLINADNSAIIKPQTQNSASAGLWERTPDIDITVNPDESVTDNMESQSSGKPVNVLPKLDKIKIPIEKFTQYALNPLKDENKALAFDLALGYNLSNVDSLIENIKKNLSKFPAKLKSDKRYGDIYEVVLELQGANGKSAKVLTGWLDDRERGEIRLTTVHID
jgi:SPP1 gp7 family putative phage head morphogenesis protein